MVYWHFCCMCECDSKRYEWRRFNRTVNGKKFEQIWKIGGFKLDHGLVHSPKRHDCYDAEQCFRYSGGKLGC